MDQHSVTLPRDFRFSVPKTPEPTIAHEESRVPSPPRARLRVKRRVASQLSAPTQQFLASVAAADLPIPSIEEPDKTSDTYVGEIDSFSPSEGQDRGGGLLLPPRDYIFSPPKTPSPDYSPSHSPTQYPNWTVGSTGSSSVGSTSDHDDFSRPSTSRSTHTSASLFSRLSCFSDDECLEGDSTESEDLQTSKDLDSNSNTCPRRTRKAQWTKNMSDHLWATYALYLHDPTVTPFRMGKSCIPPHGVLLRVAREAKRSWKGSKALNKSQSDARKSGSCTPTTDDALTFIRWPHTCAATRSHLRELCKLKKSHGLNRYVMSRSPTPFSQATARHWSRRTTPGRAPVFATQDMSVSLAISTADSMQPQGILAQLASAAKQTSSQKPSSSQPTLLTAIEDVPFVGRNRLGSPFGARSYGPSSSGMLAQSLSLGSPMPRRRTHTVVGPRRTLQSPVHMSRSSTQRRRNTQSNDQLTRLSILSDLWLAPQSDTKPTSVLKPANPSHGSSLFGLRGGTAPVLTASNSMPQSSTLIQPKAVPPRLGSPFVAQSSSFSFPNRLLRQQPGSVDLGALGRTCSTLQQIHDPVHDPVPDAVRTNLVGRLAYIDQRLKELRDREHQRLPDPAS